MHTVQIVAALVFKNICIVSFKTIAERLHFAQWFLQIVSCDRSELLEVVIGPCQIFRILLGIFRKSEKFLVCPSHIILGFFYSSDIADDAGEHALPGNTHFCDAKFQWEGRAVMAQT